MTGTKRIWIIAGTVLVFLLGIGIGFCYGIHSMQEKENASAEKKIQLEIEGNKFCDQIGSAVESHDSVWLTEHYAGKVSEERFAVYEDMKLTYLGSVRGDTRFWDAAALSRDYTLLFGCPLPIPQIIRESLPVYEVMKIEETERLSIIVHIANSENSSWSYVIQSFP